MIAFQSNAFQTDAFQIDSVILSRFLPNGGSGGTRKHHQPERWQDHVPSFVLQEQRKAALEKQQKRNAAIMALAI